MSWFLTRSRGKRKRSKPSGKSVGPKPWDPQRTLLGLKVLGLFTLAVGMGVGWRYGEEALRRYASRHHATPITAEQVILADAPGWMPLTVRDHLQQVVAEEVSPDPLDGRGLRRAAAALAHDPWVRQVQQVQRLEGGRVKVIAAYREPLAVVESEQGYYIVDSQGVRLPGLYGREQVERMSLPRIVGVASDPPRRAGESWPAQDLQAGLSLVQLLAAEPYLYQIEAFDVSERDARGRIRLVLRTRQGAVIWGLPPGQEHAIEPGAPIKLDRLRLLVQKKGSIDAGGRVVEIYGPVIQTHQLPLGRGDRVGIYTIGP